MKEIEKQTIKFAFIQTIPILFSYVFIGIAFGIILQQAGYNFIWAFFISTFVYSGAIQFVLITFLSTGASITTVLMTTIFISGRHIFYGLSFIDTFKKMGRLFPYMIHTLTDETYSVYCACNFREEIYKEKALFYIGFFNQCYWIIGSVIGSLLGQMILFDFKGVDFCMTALFVVIFIDQWKNFQSHLPAIIGLCSGIIFLIILGPDKFILPSLIVTVALLIFCKDKVNKDKIEVEVEA